MLRLLRLALATWRVASMLVQEDGPGDVFAILREHAGVRRDVTGKPYSTNVIGSALTCLWCTSVWAALFIVVLDRFAPALVDVLAASTVAIGWHKQVMS